MQAALLIPLVASAVFGGGFVANEWTHGAMSEAMGMGHHHALDYQGMHCATHDHPEHAAHHVDHMHNATGEIPHEGCPGGAGMHAGGRMT